MRRKNTNSGIYVAIAAIAVIVIVIAISSGSNSGGSTNVLITPTTQQIQTAESSQSTPSLSTGTPTEMYEFTSPKQEIAFKELSQNSKREITLRVDNGVVKFLTIELENSLLQNNPINIAKNFLIEYQDFMNINIDGISTSDFLVINLDDGSYKVQYIQKIDGTPVYGANITFLISSIGTITSIYGGYSPLPANPILPNIDSADAEQIVINTYSIDPIHISSGTTLLYVDGIVLNDEPSDLRLVWKITIIDDSGQELNSIFVDAVNSEIIKETPHIINYQVNVFNNQNKPYTNLNKAIQIMNKNGCITGQSCDADANNAFNFATDYEKFVLGIFNPPSYDSDSERIDAYTHVKIPINLLCLQFGGENAFWDGKAILFTDGMSAANDVVYHELTHRLTENLISVNSLNNSCGGLCYEGQSGALSESFSDIFAILLDNGNIANKWDSPKWEIVDWELGEDIGNIIRNISLSPPVLQVEKRYTCLNDYGWVHENSLIPSHAAYLLLQTNDVTRNSITVTGLGPTKVSHIYYHALEKFISQNSDFLNASYGIHAACIELIGNYGITTKDCNQILNAFSIVGIGNPANQKATPTPSPLPIGNVDSSTVMVLDTSGSMDEADITGLSKLQAAQKAADNIINIASSESQQNNTITTRLGLVNYNYSAEINYDLTTDYSSLQNELNNLSAGGGTGMAEGLQTGIGLFNSNTTNEKQMIILLSDGMANIPINSASSYDEGGIKQEVIDLASQAGSQGICVYTIGFGVPGGTGGISFDASIDEEFLREVAAASGCGTYYNAQDSIQLSNVFVGLRHSSMGTVLFERTGQIAQGEQLDLGTVAIPANQELALFTLNWPGSKLELNIQDPAGTPVNENYPGATFALSPSIVSVVLSNPMPGDWRLGILGVDVPEGMTNFNTIISSRVGLATPLPAATPTPQAVTLPAGSGNSGMIIFLLVAAAIGVILFIFVQSKNRTKKAAFNSQLNGVSGSFTGQTITIRDRFTIGRSAGNSLVINDPKISRSHAQFRYANDAWFIQDLGSSAGTFVNGKRINGQRLANGDQVQISNHVFTFRSGGQ